jgi:AcrR family transcriptional regulator
MPQRLKEEVRQKILASGARIFAEKGYGGATLAEVAHRSNIATSNIYKYFPNKQALLNAIVTPSVAARLLCLMRRRVKEVTGFEDWRSAQVRQSAPAAELLSFWIEHQCQVLILLRGADGTRFCNVRALFVAEMERMAIRFLVTTQGADAVTQHDHFVLKKIFANTADMIVQILDVFEEPEDIQRAFATFWNYQLSGLQGLLESSR